MVKRTKNVSRPAGRRASPKPAARPAARDADPAPVRSGAALSEEEVRRAEEFERQMRAQELAAEQMRRRGRGARDVDVAVLNAPLAVRAAKEYAYVARDVRHILFTASIMVAILAFFAILIDVLGVIKL
jgi:hypothetical protein